MEENQDLKVCQDIYILPFEKIMGMGHVNFRTARGRGKGMQTQDFSYICIMSLIERERYVLNMTKR